jgi:hypothetical protein
LGNLDVSEVVWRDSDSTAAGRESADAMAEKAMCLWFAAEEVL